MTRLICLVAVAIVSGVTVLAAPKEDLVTDLPGLTWKPNFKQYSGYLDISPNGSLHYWMVESASSPSTDPLIVFVDNLPICNPLLEVLSGVGPFTLREDGATIVRNPYSWNAHASILYLEVPAQVGFSRNVTEFPRQSEMAYGIVNGMIQFYKKFPEYKQNGLYFAVRFAGVEYVLWSGSIISQTPDFTNFQGYVVLQGGYPGPFPWNGLYYNAYYRGIVSREAFRKMLMVCCKTLNVSYCDFYHRAQHDLKCYKAFRAAILSILSDNRYNVVNVYLPLPYGINNDTTPQVPENQTKDAIENMKEPSPLHSLHQKWEYTLCISRNMNYMVKYMNQNSVKKALHVDLNKAWSYKSEIAIIVDDPVSLEQRFNETFSSQSRVLMMHGDLGLDYPAFSVEWYLNSTSLQETRPRDVWFYQEDDGTTQTGGIRIKFGDVEFYTIKGAGGRMADDRPKQAFKVFNDFITKK